MTSLLFGILTVAFASDDRQAASESHYANDVFVTMVPTITPQWGEEKLPVSTLSKL